MSCQSNWPSGWNINELTNYDISKGWSGTEYCETIVTGIEEDDIWDMIWFVEQVFGEEDTECILLTGGSEQWCHGGNGTTSRHYCSRAMDIWTGGWTDIQELAVRNLMDIYGYDTIGRPDDNHMNHIHMGWGESCTVEPPD